MDTAKVLSAIVLNSRPLLGYGLNGMPIPGASWT